MRRGKERPFHSVTDLVARVTLTERELDGLIGAGALDALAVHRRAARWEAQFAREQPPGQAVLVPELEQRALPPVGPEDKIERAAEEYRMLGWTRSVPHPLDLYRRALPDGEVLPGERLRQCIDQQATIAGIVVAVRRTHTKGSGSVTFFSLCDASGTTEVVLFDDEAQHAARDIGCGDAVWATGRVRQNAEHGVTLEVTAVHVLEQ